MPSTHHSGRTCALSSQRSCKESLGKNTTKNLMKVLVNGLGNIGTTIANVLLRYREILGITTVYCHKNFPEPWLEPDLQILQEQGAYVTSSHTPQEHHPSHDIFANINYLFDCRQDVTSLQEMLSAYPNIRGACVQGSAKNIQSPFMTNVNPETITGARIVKIVSCNTHGIGALLQSFCGSSLQHLKQADVVVARRSEDIGSHKKLVSGNVVVGHNHPQHGTHHGTDLHALFATKNIPCNITTSDITTPSQFMHSLRFSITLQHEYTHDDFTPTPLTAVTKKFDSNALFELGRRYGFQGRIFSHVLIVEPSLLIDGKTLKGWAFVPQEGNTVLSSIHAFLLQIQPQSAQRIMKTLQADLLRQEW